MAAARATTLWASRRFFINLWVTSIFYTVYARVASMEPKPIKTHQTTIRHSKQQNIYFRLKHHQLTGYNCKKQFWFCSGFRLFFMKSDFECSEVFINRRLKKHDSSFCRNVMRNHCGVYARISAPILLWEMWSVCVSGCVHAYCMDLCIVFACSCVCVGGTDVICNKHHARQINKAWKINV